MLLPATYQIFCISGVPHITLITTQPSSSGPGVGVSDLRASKAFYVRSLFSLGRGAEIGRVYQLGSLSACQSRRSPGNECYASMRCFRFSTNIQIIKPIQSSAVHPETRAQRTIALCHNNLTNRHAAFLDVRYA